MNKQYVYKPNDTTKFFDGLNKILYILGLPNFWIEAVKLSERFVKIYNIISPIIHGTTVIFSILQFGALFTQQHLDAKQKSDAMVGMSNPLTVMFVLIYYYYRDESREVLYYLAVVLKEVHNDADIERNLIKKLRFYLIAYSCSASAILGYYGLNGLMQVVQAGELDVGI